LKALCKNKFHRKPKSKIQNMICSELVAEALQRLGGLVDFRNPQNEVPAATQYTPTSFAPGSYLASKNYASPIADKYLSHSASLAR
jgi:hypothetical protein